jgi:hypothetical protein
MRRHMAYERWVLFTSLGCREWLTSRSGATACETGLWPAGTFTRAYTANRKAAIEGLIDSDPIAACVRELMSERSSWTGSAGDLLRVSVERSSLTTDNTG